MSDADELKNKLPSLADEYGWPTEFLVAVQAFLRDEEFSAESYAVSRAHLSLYFAEDDALLLEWDTDPVTRKGRLRTLFCWHTPHEVIDYGDCDKTKGALREQGYFNRG